MDIATEIGLMLVEGAGILSQLSDGGRVIKMGGAFGDASNDTETKADKILSEHYLHRLQSLTDVASLQVEGLGVVEKEKGKYHVVCDPLDGSLNYKMRGQSLGLPYSACVAVFEGEDRNTLTYRDIVYASCLDYRARSIGQLHFDAWEAWKRRGGDGLFTTFRSKAATTIRDTTLDLGKMIVIGEMYYPENREKLCRAFAGKKGWLRSPGSAAYEMALLAAGIAVAFICDRQKQHELPTGVALTLGAGGVAVDFDGKPLLDACFNFNTQQSTILAANQPIADQILELLHR